MPVTQRSTFRIEWNGEEIKAAAKEAVSDALVEFGNAHERAAKDQLAPGRGVRTGRVKKSIHAAAPSYNWSGDWASPGRSAPERSGVAVEPEVRGSSLVVAVGTGIGYGVLIEGVYQYLRKSHDQVLPQLPGMVEKHAKAHGLGE